VELTLLPLVACRKAKEEAFLRRYCNYTSITPVQGFKLGPKDARYWIRTITLANKLTARCNSGGRLFIRISLKYVRDYSFMGKFTPSGNV